jgi:hypothetical protein
MIRICNICGDDYEDKYRKSGLVIHCDSCAEETAIPYTGNMIYDHKTGGEIQINTDPALTDYLNGRPEGYGIGNNSYESVSGFYTKSGSVKKVVKPHNVKGE